MIMVISFTFDWSFPNTLPSMIHIPLGLLRRAYCGKLEIPQNAVYWVLGSMKRMNPILIIWPNYLQLVSLVVAISHIDSHGTLSMLLSSAYLSLETWKKQYFLELLVSTHIECENRDIVTYNFFLSDSCLSMWGGESYRIHDMKYQHSFNIFELEISTFIAFEGIVAKKKFFTISSFSEAAYLLLLH